MGDGWETRRRRGPGYDWAIVRLGAPGIVSKIEIDTNHFKGNYPDSASLEGCLAPGASLDALARRRRGDDPAADEAVGEQAAFLFRQAAAAERRRVARAAEHLPGRRRQPLADPWNAGSEIDDGRRADAHATLCGVLRIVALDRPDAGAASFWQSRCAADGRARGMVGALAG